MSAGILSKIDHDLKYPKYLGGVMRILPRVRQLPVPVVKIGPGIPTVRAGLYAEQAGAPSV